MIRFNSSLIKSLMLALIIRTARFSYFRRTFLSDRIRNGWYTMFHYRFGQFIERNFFYTIRSSITSLDRFAGSLFDYFVPPGFTVWMQHESSVGGFFQSVVELLNIAKRETMRYFSFQSKNKM